MRAHLIRSLHHARRGLFYTGAIVLILIAIAVAIADRLLPLVQRHPDRIAAWLIQRSGQPVHFDRAEAHWTNRGPLFTLYNLRLGQGADQLAVDRAELLVAMYSGVLPDHPFTELRLHGLALTIERDASGRWHLVGLSGPREAENHNPLSSLEGLGELQVSDARLTVRAPAQGFSFTSPRVALRMRVTTKRLRAGLRVASASGAPLLAAFDFNRRDNDGTLWIGSDNIDLAPWSGFLGYAGVWVERGRGRLQAWSMIRDSRVASVQVEAALHDIAVGGPPTGTESGATPPQHIDLASVAISARLRKLPGGWEFVAPRLHLRSRDGTEDSLDGIELRDALGVAIAARHVDAGILLSIAMLSDRLPAGLRGWLLQAAPQVRLSALRAGVEADGTLRGSAHLDEAGWKPVGERPAIQGITGSVLFDRNAISLTFDKSAPGARAFRLLWPPAFIDPVPLAVQGTLTAWRDGSEWVLESSDLHARNDDLDLSARLAMRFRSDGRKPRLDLFATVQPANMVDAKHYWLRHKMPPKTVAWLDNAIEGGKIAGAHVIVAGDLDDWPFRHDEGRFDAVADLVDARLHFDPDWPRAEHVTGQLVFNGPGMHFDGSASIVGIQASQLSASIPDFHEAVLDIRSNALGSGPQMLALLRQSPLAKKFGETFAALDIRGEGLQGTMHLSLPLKRELGLPKVDGDVKLHDAGLSDKRWDIHFTGVSGGIHYDQSGVLATLDVKVGPDPATFRLAIGDATGDAATAVDATLSGRLPAATLIDHAPTLDWLKPVFSGRGVWAVEVRVPTSLRGANAPALLSVRSDLRGVALNLPAPLSKPVDTALPLLVTASLPASAGDIRASLGNVLDLRGRSSDTSPFRGVLAFGGTAAGTLPANGLAVSGHVAELDAAGWVALAGGTAGVAGAGGLQSVDVQADSLALGGRHFANTRLRMSRQPEATSLRLDGDALAGNFIVPNVISRGITAQVERLYWPASGVTSSGALVADADAEPGFDPASVPPLKVDVADLRFGEARLGHVVLRSHPVPQGLHIDQLDATAKSQTVSATGDWLRAGGNATRTHLAIEFNADSLGKMLDAFGFKGVVAAGKTVAKLQASWPGSPTAFRLAALDGTLDLKVGEGRLLEVKPGAGRILGLVSLAELPRRLSLDFRDFFDKGFSFKTMSGRFVFGDGQARVDDLAIRGPAADIHVSGSVNLVAQTYDQTIDVLPKAGGIVTAVGAAVAGPVGAAVGAVAGVVLKRPLQQLAHKRYHVTGPWSDPVVKPVQVGPELRESPESPSN